MSEQHHETSILRPMRRPSPWRLIIGPLLTVILAVGVEALSRTPWALSSPGTLYLFAVVYATYLGGMGAGLVSAAIALALALVFFSIPERPVFHYAPEEFSRLLQLVIALPAAAVLVGILKRRDEQRVHEAARAQALEHYRDMIQELAAIIWERDPENLRITFVSRRAETLLGYPIDQWLSEPDFWPRRLHPEDRDRITALYREAVARGIDRVLEYRVIAADGRVVWLRDAVRVMPDPRGRRRLRGVMMDITDRKRVETALRASEARKAGILSSALDAIMDIDQGGRITEFNPAAERMFGVRRDEVIGREMASLIIPPALRESHRRGLAHYLATGEGPILGQRIELPALGPDGKEFPVELAVIRVALDGEVSFTGFVRDITLRKRSEDALRTSERNYRLLMEKASDGIVITDYDANFEDVNAKVCELLGYSRDELIGKNVRDIIPAEELQRMPMDLESLRSGRPLMLERWLRRKDGTLIPVEISALRLDERRLHGIYRDISERKRAETELREAFSLLSATLDATADGILVVNREGKISSFNRRFHEMWRIPEQILASRDDDQALAHVLDQLKDPQGFLTKVRELYAQPEAQSFDVLEFKDGRVFERYSQPQRIAGVSVGRVWSFRDVTERRRAEQALRQSEEHLRHAQQMEAIGRLAGGIAHDFNNLLTVIIGNSSLMLQNLSATDPRRLEAEEIQKAAERAASLTRQLLAFGRKQMLEMRVLDLNAVLADMSKMLRRVIGEQIDLVSVPAPDLGRVKVDPGQLEQVILNLVLNARDAMPRGGKLIIETANTHVDGSFAQRHPPLRAGEYVMLAVSDSGIGMDPDTQGKIFEPFFTTKEQGKGTGLGLATVYGIVRQSDGYIWVYSQPGKGSTFKIYLPRVADLAESLEPTVGGIVTTRGTETVLLVEDEALVRTLVRNTLQERGYTVMEAEDGEQALRISEQHTGPLQLLITDVVMPGMSGRELAELLCQRRPELKVLYISGYTDDAVVQHGVLAPGAAFLQKPFTLEALARKVRLILDTTAKPQTA